MSDCYEHPEYLALLRRILEDPFDDAPRWIISDWLEEHDETKRAVEIRRQLANPKGSFGETLRITFRDGRRGLAGSCWIRRGFIETIDTGYQAFADNAHFLFGLYPITWVTLRGQPSVDGYLSSESAVFLGRHLAGLPPLTAQSHTAGA